MGMDNGEVDCGSAGMGQGRAMGEKTRQLYLNNNQIFLIKNMKTLKNLIDRQTLRVRQHVNGILHMLLYTYIYI